MKEMLRINSAISQIWDKNTVTRINDIEQGTDVTYVQTIKPWVVGEVLKIHPKANNILDIGCGFGYLTNCVYNATNTPVTGIDISPVSILYAREKYPWISFECQDFYRKTYDKKYDLGLAIMTINNMPDARLFFRKSYRVLTSFGHLIIVIPHPKYWFEKHISKFAAYYYKEAAYSLPFSTKGREDYGSNIIYFHRPLKSYVNMIKCSGFTVEKFCELQEQNSDKKPDIVGMVLKKIQ